MNGYTNAYNNTQNTLDNTVNTQRSYKTNNLTANETTRQNFENLNDSMEEINMISKVKELTESASKMDLNSTPVYNLEKRLKEIKLMMNKVCAK